MDQIQFAKAVCLVQRIMDASDASISYSSSYEEKEWDSMVNACIPAHQDIMDSEHQIWTDVQVSSMGFLFVLLMFLKAQCSFYWEAIIHTLFLRWYVVEHNIFIEVMIFIKTYLLMSKVTPRFVMFSKLNSCVSLAVIASLILIKTKVRKELWFKQQFLV